MGMKRVTAYHSYHRDRLLPLQQPTSLGIVEIPDNLPSFLSSFFVFLFMNMTIELFLSFLAQLWGKV